MKQIYLDNAATTRVDDEVLKEMESHFVEGYGNASSQHAKGQAAKQAMEKARKTIAKFIGARTHEIIFTGSGTESNNLVVKGLFFENYPEKNHIIVSKIEHDCILNACKWLETQGADITYLDVDSEGFVKVEDVENAITDKTILVSVIHGNNEIGTIQNLESIGKVCREKGVLFHTDACQSFTKTELDVKKQNLDLVTLNAHKIHGPKGVGALYIKDGIKITPIAHGGGHENNLRSGTENIPGIAGFAKSVSVASKKDVERMKELRNKLIEGILKISDTKLNGPRENRLCNNVNISFSNIEGEALGGYLENEGIFTSTGSACSSHSLEPSHVLTAIGLSPVQINSSIRISISKYTTESEVDYFLEVLPKIVEKLRRISPLVNNDR
jgi:cysteine desulfurase